MGVLELQIIEE